MKKKSFSIAVAIAIVLGSLIGVWLGNTTTSILSGAVSGLLAAWCATTNWAEAAESLRARFGFVSEIYTAVQRDVAQRREARELIERVAERDPRHARMLQLFKLQARATGSFFLFGFVSVFVVLPSVVSEESAMLAIVTFATIVFLIVLFEFTIYNIGVVLSEPLQFYRYSRAHNLKDQLVEELSFRRTEEAPALEVVARIRLQSACELVASRYEQYLVGEQSLLAAVATIAVKSIANIVLLPVFLVLLVAYGLFVFANHRTRIKAATAGLCTLIHLSASYAVLGGILWANPNFWLSLVVFALVGGLVAGYLTQGAKRPLGEASFSRPPLQLIRI